jgi:hypothetical protein
VAGQLRNKIAGDEKMRGETVIGETKERWRILCERAADEQDVNKLLELIREINDLLEAKEQRLRRAETPAPEDTAPAD